MWPSNKDSLYLDHHKRFDILTKPFIMRSIRNSILPNKCEKLKITHELQKHGKNCLFAALISSKLCRKVERLNVSSKIIDFYYQGLENKTDFNQNGSWFIRPIFCTNKKNYEMRNRNYTGLDF